MPERLGRLLGRTLAIVVLTGACVGAVAWPVMVWGWTGWTGFYVGAVGQFLFGIRFKRVDIKLPPMASDVR